MQAKEKEERYLRRQQRRAELEQKRREKSSVSENTSSAAVSVNTSGVLPITSYENLCFLTSALTLPMLACVV